MMNLCKEFLLKTFLVDENNIIEKEDLQEYNISFDYAGKELSKEDIKCILNAVDSNDKIIINQQYRQDKVDINSSDSAMENFLTDINSDLETGKITLCVNITKGVEKYISVYSSVKLFEYFDSFDFYSFFKFFNSIIKDKPLHFKMLNDNVQLLTDSMCFSNQEGNNSFFKRDEYIDKIRLATKTNLEFPLYSTPCDFRISVSKSNDNHISNTVERFKKIEYILSLLCISNESLLSKQQIKFLFSGLKNIEINYSEYSENDIVVNDFIVDIFNWSYNEGNTVDKLGIVRNVLSINYNNDNFESISDSEFQSIIGNYLLYLRNNVQDYLKLKETVTIRFQSFCDECSDQITQLSSTLRKNFLALLGYLITVLLTKGISNSIDDIFSKEVAIISSFVLIGSFVVWGLSFIYCRNQMKYLDKKISKFREYYKDIITDKELNKIIDDNTLIIFAKERNNKLIWVYSIIWIVTLVVLFLALDALSGSTKLLYLINFFN